MKFVRTEPEFAGGPLFCEFPDNIDVKELLDNGWVKADKEEHGSSKVEKTEPKVESKPVENESKSKTKVKSKTSEPMF